MQHELHEFGPSKMAHTGGHGGHIGRRGLASAYATLWRDRPLRVRQRNSAHHEVLRITMKSHDLPPIRPFFLKKYFNHEAGEPMIGTTTPNTNWAGTSMNVHTPTGRRRSNLR